MRLCRHCGVRIMQLQLDTGPEWMHVYKHGAGPAEVYRACKLAFVAEPHGNLP